MNILLTPLMILQTLSSALTFDGQTIKPPFFYEGHVLQQQGFLIELEDFGHLQSYLLTKDNSCEKRILDIQRKHASQVLKIQEDCRKRNSFLENELEKKIQENSLLEEDLKQAEKEKKIWIITAAGATTVLSTLLILNR